MFRAIGSTGGEVAASVGEHASGVRAVAGPDEDTTTMAVAAAHAGLPPTNAGPGSVWFATTEPAYADKTNATTVHAALGLPETVGAFDIATSVRSGAAALLAASKCNGMAVLSDIRGGHAGGTNERDGGDAAAAFVFGDDDVLAEVVSTISVSAEFLDRWRVPGETASRTWEERFGEQEYSGLADRALDQLVTSSGCGADEIDGVVVAGPNPRAVKAVRRAFRRRTGGRSAGAELADQIGNTGAAHVGLVLAAALDEASSGELLLVTSLADGADLILLRATDEVGEHQHRPDTLGREVGVSYPTYLVWRGRIDRVPPRRPEPVRPSAPFAARNADYKFGFTGARCRSCGTVQFPRPRVCLQCRTLDSFEPVPTARLRARVATFTVDRLAVTPSPPMVSAILDFDSGGRVQCELTDVDADEIRVGDLVEMTFRRLGTVEGVHNYFWKARPVRAEEGR